MPAPLLVLFVGGQNGPWKVESQKVLAGLSLPAAKRLAVYEGGGPEPEGLWTLRGFTSNSRYTGKDEKAALDKVQPPLNRPEATCAALIPIKKSQAWWDMGQ